jgi:hypothetical protein
MGQVGGFSPDMNAHAKPQMSELKLRPPNLEW